MATTINIKTLSKLSIEDDSDKEFASILSEIKKLTQEEALELLNLIAGTPH